MKYRAEIDGLRALAVLPVILFHAGFEWFSGGFVGVDVFFVISGYLITTIIIFEMAEGKFSIVNFYERRARRILPALFFVMLVCLPFAWLWLPPTHLKDFGESLVSVSTFSSNILFWYESGYFDTEAELKPLLHTWSLAVEEQYYIIFPVFLMLTWRLGIKTISILLSIVFLISLGVAVWGTQYETHPKIISGAFFLLPTRGWELLIGVFAAIYLKYNTHIKSHFLNQSLSLLGFGMILYSILIFDETTPFPSLYTLIPTIGTGLLILCAVPKTLIHKLLSLKFFVGIGLISYSAYLWHQPLLVFNRHLFVGNVAEIYLVILCIFSFLIAWFSWHFIEKPFRNKSQATRKFIFNFAIAGMTMFSLVGVYVIQKNGFFEHFVTQNSEIKDGDIGHDDFHNYVEENYTECANKEILDKAPIWQGSVRCQQSSTREPNIAIFGDSHAEHLFLGLNKNISKNEYIYLIGRAVEPAGEPFVGDSHHKHLINYIVNNDEIDTVIYSLEWYEYYLKLGEKDFKTNIIKTLELFLKSDKNIVVIAGTPDFLNGSVKCFFVQVYNSAKNSCELSFEEFEKQRKYLPLLQEITTHLGVELIDPSKLFCDDIKCRMIINHTIMFRDNDHLNIPGSKLVGKFISNNSLTLSNR